MVMVEALRDQLTDKPLPDIAPIETKAHLTFDNRFAIDYCAVCGLIRASDIDGLKFDTNELTNLSGLLIDVRYDEIDVSELRHFDFVCKLRVNGRISLPAIRDHVIY